MFWVVSEVCRETNVMKRVKIIKNFIRCASRCHYSTTTNNNTNTNNNNTTNNTTNNNTTTTNNNTTANNNTNNNNANTTTNNNNNLFTQIQNTNTGGINTEWNTVGIAAPSSGLIISLVCVYRHYKNFSLLDMFAYYMCLNTTQCLCIVHVPGHCRECKNFNSMFVYHACSRALQGV